MTRLKEFWQCEAGATAAEYALMLAIIGSALTLGAIVLGGVIGAAMNDTGDCIQDKTAC